MKFLLVESKEDIQAFIDKFGQDTYDSFLKQKDILKKANISTDLTWHVKHTDVDKLNRILQQNRTQSQQNNDEVAQICKTPEANDIEDLGEQDGYHIYKINTPEASVKYGLVVGGKAKWCISGGYDNKEGSILAEAKKYFYEYLAENYYAYFILIGHGTKYCVCLHKNLKDFDIWAQDDSSQEFVPMLESPIRYKQVDIHCEFQEFQIIDGNLKRYHGEATEVVIPSGVTKIGDMAFRKCHNLTSITIPNSVTEIGNAAFARCSRLTSITIPNSVTSIGEDAFACCSRLTSITIPSQVTSIGDYAFADCSSLTSITIPNSVTKIGDSAFSNCHSLTNITIPNSVNCIADGAFYACCSLTNINIPNSVTEIGEGTFSGCSNLTGITIPNSVTSIWDYAFSMCSSLTSITIPSSVTKIGDYAFERCDKLNIICKKDSHAYWYAQENEIPVKLI